MQGGVGHFFLDVSLYYYYHQHYIKESGKHMLVNWSFWVYLHSPGDMAALQFSKMYYFPF